MRSSLGQCARRTSLLQWLSVRTTPKLASPPSTQMFMWLMTFVVAVDVYEVVAVVVVDEVVVEVGFFLLMWAFLMRLMLWLLLLVLLLLPSSSS